MSYLNALALRVAGIEGVIVMRGWRRSIVESLFCGIQLGCRIISGDIRTGRVMQKWRIIDFLPEHYH